MRRHCINGALLEKDRKGFRNFKQTWKAFHSRILCAAMNHLHKTLMLGRAFQLLSHRSFFRLLFKNVAGAWTIIRVTRTHRSHEACMHDAAHESHSSREREREPAVKNEQFLSSVPQLPTQPGPAANLPSITSRAGAVRHGGTCECGHGDRGRSDLPNRRIRDQMLVNGDLVL